MNGLSQRLRGNPEIAIFLALALGYYFGKFTYKGIGLGSVTSTLIAGVVIGQIGITINQPLKAFSFLMFLFAVGYGVGPQFVRGIAKDGVPQAIFSVVQCVFCLITAVVIAKMAGYDLGYSAGLYAGSQTISASMGLATDAINRAGLAADQAKGLIDNDTGRLRGELYVRHHGLGDRHRHFRPHAAAHRSRRRLQGVRGEAGRRQEGDRRARHGLAPLGGARVQGADRAARRPASGSPRREAMVPNARLFILRIRRDGQIMEATADTVLKEGDVVAVAGEREVLVTVLQAAVEVEDRELLAVPVEGVDVLVTNKDVDGKTLTELAGRPDARGVFLRKITRGATATDIPDPAEHQDQPRRPAHPRRPHAGRRRRHQDARRRGSSDRRHRHGVRRRLRSSSAR